MEHAGSILNCGICGVQMKVPRTRPASGWVYNDDVVLAGLVGTGGMSVVFKGYRISQDDNIAIKILDADVSQKGGVPQLFMQEARTNESTLEHQSKIDGVTVVESWLIEDKKKDKAALYGFELPIGTWMLSVKVNNADIWDKVKAKDVRGFSVEGYFTDRLVEMMKGKLCKNCPEDKEILEKLKAIILDELKPSSFLNDKPLFDSKRTAELWGQMFHDVSGFEEVKLNGQTLYTANYRLESYDWDTCVREQTAEYGSKEIAEKVCGTIRAKYG